jgi:hypothetical protein
MPGRHLPCGPIRAPLRNETMIARKSFAMLATVRCEGDSRESARYRRRAHGGV